MPASVDFLLTRPEPRQRHSICCTALNAQSECIMSTLYHPWQDVDSLAFLSA